MKNKLLIKVMTITVCSMCLFGMLHSNTEFKVEAVEIQPAKTTDNMDGNVVEIGTKKDNGSTEEVFEDDWLITEPNNENGSQNQTGSSDGKSQGQNGKKQKIGWYKEKGQKYYYINNKKVKGWKKISGKQYYFKESGSEKGSLQVNCIAGNKKGGYYYVDSKGVKVNKKAINKVVSLARNNTKKSWKNKKKLSNIYKYMISNYKLRDGEVKISSGNIDKATVNIIKNKKGNSLAFSATFAYASKVLGYDSRVVSGTVTYDGVTKDNHVWTETKIGSKWYVFDLSTQIDKNIDCYKIKANNKNVKYNKNKTLTLKVKNGKVTWK